MAASRARVIQTCLAFSQHNKLFGIVSRNFSLWKAGIETSSMSRTQNYAVAARRVCSSVSPLNISDKDEELELPKAADSHLTPSVFDNELVNKFVNCMMWDGKKSVSQTIFKRTLEDIKTEQLKKQRESSTPDSVQIDPLQIFLEAVENCKPVVGVISMTRGGRVFQVPTPLKPNRRRFLAIKWLITAAREEKSNRNARMYKKLAKELLDAYNNEGTVIKKKRELHKRAEDNRAFAHFRWW